MTNPTYYKILMFMKRRPEKKLFDRASFRIATVTECETDMNAIVQGTMTG